MSGNPNDGMLPDDENQNQTGNQGQNPGQYADQNSIQGNSWDSSSSNTVPVGPGQSYTGQNAGLDPWGQQPQIPQVQQANQPNHFDQGNWNYETQDIPRMSNHIINQIFNRPLPNPQVQARAWNWALRQLRDLEQMYTAMVAVGCFDHDSSLDISNLSSFEIPGSAGLDPNNTGNVGYSPAGPAPVQSQQHEPHSIAGHPNMVNALPAPPTIQGSFAGPRRKKRGPAASPDTTAPAPKRTRNLQPNASGDEGDNANSSGIPGPTPNTTSPSSRQPQRTRKRKADIDEEKHDGEDDLPSDLRPQKKSRGEPAASKTKSNSRRNLKKEDHEWVVKGTICDFCSKHPQSKPCDWEQVSQSNGPEVYNIECTNCANYRSVNKDNTELAEKGGHKCQVPGPRTPLIYFEHKRYGVGDPQSPGPLYYLALGYGSGGVNDFKDGQSLEHWIGPTAPVYGLIDPKDGPRHYRFVAEAHRSHRPPAGIVRPPILPFGVELKDTPVGHLRWLINELWPNKPQSPKNDLRAYQKVWNLLCDFQNLQMKQAGMEPNLPVSIVRSFQGGPVLSDIEGMQDRMLPSAHRYPNDTQSQGFSQSLTNQLPKQNGNPYNPQQNASAPPTQPYQHSAAHQPGGFMELLNESDEDPAALGQEEYGGFGQQQPHAPAQQSQPMRPSPGPADQQIYGGPDQQPFFDTHGERQMPQDQVLPNQQGCGNLGQQQLDPYSQQMVSPQDPAGDEQDSQGRDNRDWLEKLIPLQISVDADDESDERRTFANSVMPAQDIENDQQEPHSGSQAPDQSPEGSSESRDEFLREFGDFVDLDGKQAHRRSRASRGERRHKPQTSRGSQKSSQERMARGNRVPKNANDQDAFNPFLGFTLGPDQKPQFKEKPKSSRWKVFNHLEGIDMSEWHESKSKEPEEESQIRLFSIVNGQTDQPTPLRDVLGDVPHEEKVKRTKRYCAEPGEGGWGLCGSWDTGEQGQATCQSSAHRNTVLPYFPVCNDCTRGNVKYLFQHEHNPITESELSMRAYLCNECAGQMSSGAPNAVQNQIVGTRRVYGIAADEAHSQNRQKLVKDSSQAANLMRNTEALTGCSCTNRMLGPSLCRFHRLYYAEEVMKHAALMQEWRLSRFKKAVCPSCLAQKPSEQVNVSANVDGFVTGAPTAWACVVCSDWVVNEQNDVNNQPKAIDKPLWNLNIGRKLLGPHREITTGRVLGEVVSV
ncbi:hypothetical protein FACUT_10993 [Fusarium acutatum]|uniref:Uncharacterized protein n=1 Tax=Fusarium acutatum TaxID=78861 RepID=A0A8H4JDW9_9HYPO|nr:hypothetical protein FACUT_10993 [Fusarium acutatum]